MECRTDPRTSVYVGYPKIAQNTINKSGLNVTSFSAMNPSPTQFSVDFVSSLWTHSQYHPILRSFNASISLSKEKDPLFYFESPEVKKAKMGAIQHVHQDVQIVDADAFVEFSKALLLNDTVTTYLQGKGGVKEGHLPQKPVNYNTRSTIGGTSTVPLPPLFFCSY